jgi:glycerate dehydrogenase
MVQLNTGVFLDLGSVDNGDLDTGRLGRSLPAWRWHEATGPSECAQRIAGAQVVISNKVVLDRAILAGAESLRLVAVAATGTNNVDLEAAAEHDIMVCNARDYGTGSVTQHTITLILNLLSSQAAYRDRVLKGDWSRAQQFCLLDLPIREVSGLSLGIIGHGVIGRSVASLARKLGMNVLVAERRGRKPRGDHLAFEDVVAHSDVISIHCPLNDETRGLFDRAMMQRMKRSAILINTSRGGIVDEHDLAGSLRDGIIAGAGIDVLTTEPPSCDHPLLQGDVPNLLVTPHNAWASRRARQALLDQLASVIRAFERGQPLNRLV